MPEKFQFRIARGEQSQFAIFPENFNPKERDMAFLQDVRLRFDASTRRVEVATEAKLEYPHITDRDKVLVKVGCNMVFELHPDTLAGLPKSESGKTILPKSIAQYFASLSYSSLRGILMAHADECTFKIPVLPPFNYNKIIVEDIPSVEDKF